MLTQVLNTVKSQGKMVCFKRGFKNNKLKFTIKTSKQLMVKNIIKHHQKQIKHSLSFITLSHNHQYSTI